MNRASICPENLPCFFRNSIFSLLADINAISVPAKKPISRIHPKYTITDGSYPWLPKIIIFLVVGTPAY
jgi:hypothetical protein